MRKTTWLAAVSAFLLAGTAAEAGAQTAETVTLDYVGAPVESIDEVVDGGHYLIWMEAETGNDRHGLVYVRSHACGDGSAFDRVAAHNNDAAMPTAGTAVEASAVFVVEVDRSGEQPRLSFKTSSGRYIDSEDRGKNPTGGDPIHESTDKGFFYLAKQGHTTTLTEAGMWYLKSATATGNRVFVNTGGRDTGGLVFFGNGNADDDRNSRLKLIPVGKVTLRGVGAPVESIDEVVDGGHYLVWMETETGDNRHGLVYVRSHTHNGTGPDVGDRVSAHNNGGTMPTAGTTVEASAVFTVEVDRSGEQPRLSFKTSSGKYVDSADRGAATAGDPIHESTDKGYFYLTKTGHTTTLAEAGMWYLKSATVTGNRVFVNTGGADTGGLVLFGNSNADDDRNSRLKLIPVGLTVAMAGDTPNMGNVATFSHSYTGWSLFAPANVTVYKATGVADGVVQLQEIASREIPAHTGVIFAGEGVARANLAVKALPENTDYADNRLVAIPDGGVPEAVAGEKFYVFTAGTEGRAVFKELDFQAEGFAPNKAYLSLDDTSAASFASTLAVGIGATVTAIDRTVTDCTGEEAVYDLSGRRVLKTVKGGLYVRNGQKFIAR